MTKEYYNEHKEERAEYYKIWRQENAEHIKEKRKEYYQKNKDRIKAKTKKWKKENPERDKLHCKSYRDKTHDYQIHRSKEYNNNTQIGRAGHLIQGYKRRDKETGRGDCTLTKNWILDRIFGSTCIYCGDSDWTHLGADRIDNSKPHTPDNCVCACGICNCEREGRKMSVPEFVEYRKNHPRFIDLKPKVVDVDGIKVIKKP